jgi:pimeloyl-ACP methyl ester carboxylesterase
VPANETLTVTCGDADIYVERSRGEGPTVVLLHAGVTDCRSWRDVIDALAGSADVVAYDRRGFGRTPASSADFSHVGDLVAVIDAVADEPVWLVGSSAGGGIALDAALVAAEHVAGLVLLAPAVSGSPAPELDADTARFEPLIDSAIEQGDHDRLNRLEAWLWLDGPAQPEGRVGGPVRTLFLDMNAIVIHNEVPEEAGSSGVEAWGALDQVRVPTVVACGDLDVPFLVAQSRELAVRLPAARHQPLPAVAHLPQLEQPAMVADLIAGAITS